jgi:hypothetical protein
LFFSVSPNVGGVLAFQVSFYCLERINNPDKFAAEAILAAKEFLKNKTDKLPKHPNIVPDKIKMLRIIIITFLLSTAAFFSNAQTNHGKIYFHQNHYVTYQFGYLNSPVGKTFGEKGCMSNIGFNVARFFSNRMVLGPVADIKLIPGFGFLRLSDSFLNDFNADYFNPQSSDSSNAQVVDANMNSFGKHSYGFRGNIMFYYGIMFSPFPNRAGGIMIQIKTGMLGFDAHQAVFDNTAVPNISGDDKYPFTMQHNWKFELTFKPVAFFPDYESGVDDDPESDITLTLSFYYERLNLKTAEFNGTKFSSFLTNDFMTKYAFDNRFGFKVGISFY